MGKDMIGSLCASMVSNSRSKVVSSALATVYWLTWHTLVSLRITYSEWRTYTLNEGGGIHRRNGDTLFDQHLGHVIDELFLGDDGGLDVMGTLHPDCDQFNAHRFIHVGAIT
jgi:hypothetical protein